MVVDLELVLDLTLEVRHGRRPGGSSSTSPWRFVMVVDLEFVLDLDLEVRHRFFAMIRSRRRLSVMIFLRPEVMSCRAHDRLSPGADRAQVPEAFRSRRKSTAPAPCRSCCGPTLGKCRQTMRGRARTSTASSFPSSLHQDQQPACLHAGVKQVRRDISSEYPERHVAHNSCGGRPVPEVVPGTTCCPHVLWMPSRSRSGM